MPHLVAVALVMGAAVFALAPPADPDVWWHVRTGDWILSHHRLPAVDTWSIGGAGREWVAHAWLSEVLLSLFHKAFGLRGLSLYRGLGVAVLLTCLATQAFRRTSPSRALLVTTLAVFATVGGWGERPQLLSFLLLVPTAELVRRHVAHPGRKLWWMVPLTYLWANLHGLWFLAPALVLLGVIGAIARPDPSNRWREVRALLLVATGCVVVAGLTPNGPRLLAQPLRVNGYGQFVTEWGPPDIHSVFGLGFFLMVATFLVAFARSTRKQDAYAVGQVLFAVLLGLLYIRTIAPAAVLLTPLLADALRPAVAPRPRGFAPAFVRGAMAVLVVLGIGGGLLVLTQEPELPPAAPVAATRALLEAVPQDARVLNEYAIGGWLLLFAPTAHPAIDGRAEVYPVSYVGDYIAALKMSGDWESTIEPLHANVALLHPDTPLVNGLRDQLGWVPVYA
ncbi:MAG: hypothetical protein M3P04_14605, partial [Actinomycetota bacterium]|nr:hypothetical protein [Actinomycetota bacterium]